MRDIEKVSITVPSNDTIVTLEAVKLYLRVDNSDEDDTIAGLILAARDYLDGVTGILNRAVRVQTYRLDLPGFPEPSQYATPTIRETGIVLPYPPTINVTGVTYLNENADRVTLSPSAYRVVTGSEVRGSTIMRRPNLDWPTVCDEPQPDMVSVTFQAGYANPELVPEPIKLAMLMLIGDWFENRVSTVIGTITAELPMGVTRLISPYRIIPVA